MPTAHDDLVGKVLEAARALGLLAHHCRDGRYCHGRGLPDLVIVGRNGIIFREVKTGNAETTAEQDLWGWTILQSWTRGTYQGPVVLWSVWSEADWQDGTVGGELVALA